MVRLGSFIAAGVVALSAAAQAQDTYEILVREILVVRQCGLSDELVEAGFRLQAEAMTASGEVSASEAAAARDRGRESYRRDWRNRGAGPSDPRCRDEGGMAAARFRAYVLTD
jgi:hypothetical protein